MFNQNLAEEKGIKLAGDPVDLNTAGFTGARIGMKNLHKCAIVIQMGDSTAAVVDISLKQHNASSGGTSKALEINNTAYYHKAGSATSFTKVDVNTAEDNFVLSTIFSDDPGIVVFEVNQEDLDVNNNFNYISVDIADSTAAKIASVLYVGDPDSKPGYSIDL